MLLKALIVLLLASTACSAQDKTTQQQRQEQELSIIHAARAKARPNIDARTACEKVPDAPDCKDSRK